MEVKIYGVLETVTSPELPGDEEGKSTKKAKNRGTESRRDVGGGASFKKILMSQSKNE